MQASSPPARETHSMRSATTGEASAQAGSGPDGGAHAPKAGPRLSRRARQALGALAGTLGVLAILSGASLAVGATGEAAGPAQADLLLGGFQLAQGASTMSPAQLPGLLLGVVVGVLVYNLFLYLSLRDRFYLNFALGVVLPHAIFQLIVTETDVLSQLPGTSAWLHSGLAAMAGLLSVGFLAFCMGFLQLADRMPQVYQTLQGLAVAALIWTFLSPFVAYPFNAQLALCLAFACTVAGSCASVACLLRGDRTARFFAAGSTILAAVMATVGLHCLGWSLDWVFRTQLLGAGSSLVVVLLSLSLADRFADARQQEARVRQKLLEQERYSRQTQEEMVANLKALDEFKDQFLANTSHELRTPLHGIIGLADSLLAGAAGDLPERASQSLTMIVRSGQRLTHLVNDILDFSRMNNGQVVLDLQAVDLRAEVEAVLALSRPLADRRHITVRNLVPDHLDAARADENRLQQILVNLVGNAIKFTHKGSVTVSAERRGELIAVSVVDTGIGIRREKLENIFGYLEQARIASGQGREGTGLGLAITRRLVELHGGEIHVESKVGKGTRITFTLRATSRLAMRVEHTAALLPQGALADLEEPSGESTSLDLVITGDRGGREWRVLAVDDNSVNLAVIQNHLAAHGIAVTTATSGRAALQRLAEDPSYDLVLLDVMMPEITGYEVCERIRESHSAHELPVVLVTAKGQPGDMVRGFDAGANDYLTKPFSRSELLARIRTHIELSRTNKAYARFVPREFLQLLGKDRIEDVERGDQVQRHMSVLFTDIRGFTSLSEDMSPRENFNFINSFLGRMGPYIRESRGVIAKYMGDGMMAIFPHHGADAVRAAVGMHNELHRYNGHRANCGYRPINIGVGIHYGSIMLGTVGEQQRMDGTVISSAVNLASRLEDLTRHFRVPVIASGDVLDLLGEDQDLAFRHLGKVLLKGKHRAVDAYDVFEGEQMERRARKLTTRRLFEQGVDHFTVGDLKAAMHDFAQVLVKDAEDHSARFYIEHCEKLVRLGLPDSWDGTLVPPGVDPAAARRALEAAERTAQSPEQH